MIMDTIKNLPKIEIKTYRFDIMKKILINVFFSMLDLSKNF